MKWKIESFFQTNLFKIHKWFCWFLTCLDIVAQVSLLCVRTSTHVFTKTIVEKSGENIHLFSLCMHVFGWLLVKIRVRLESRGASVSAFTENRCHMSPD